jgi:peptidoglycan/LPS O-acetylase OafA/YrhL
MRRAESRSPSSTRRARRILPAATLTLVATVIASYLFLNPVRALSALSDVVWAAFFAANYRFATVGTDYFARTAPPSPVQHYWSLAVEEQFYVVWPAMLAIALYGFSLLRGRRNLRGAGESFAGRLTVLVAIGVAVSLAWSIHDTQTNPVPAYYSTLTRAWELGVGVLVALWVRQLPKIPGGPRAAMTWVGLAGITVAAVTYTGATSFPGYAALLPVVSTALVLAGGVFPQPILGANAVLGRQPLRLIGDASYSFYLWHWPFLIIAADYAGHTLSMSTNLGLVAAAFALSLVTYHYYENPLRHAERLSTPRDALTLWPGTVAVVVLAASLAAGAINQRISNGELEVANATAVDAALKSLETPTGNARAHTHGSRHPGRPRHASARPSRYTEAVSNSVAPARERAQVQVYSLSPEIQTLTGDAYNLNGCTAGFGNGTTSPICRLGDTSSHHVAVVLGDSHAQMWMSGLVYYAHLHHWSLIPLIKEGCEPTMLLTHGIPVCKSWYRWALSQITALHPSAVVLSQAWSHAGLNGGTAAQAAYAGLRMELGNLHRRSPLVVLVEDVPPNPKVPVDCLLANSATYDSCTFRLTAAQSEVYTIAQIIARSANAEYLATTQWFCADSKCPTVIGSTIAYQDQEHVSNTYASELSAPFAGELTGLLQGGSRTG